MDLDSRAYHLFKCCLEIAVQHPEYGFEEISHFTLEAANITVRGEMYDTRLLIAAKRLLKERNQEQNGGL